MWRYIYAFAMDLNLVYLERGLRNRLLRLIFEYAMDGKAVSCCSDSPTKVKSPVRKTQFPSKICSLKKWKHLVNSPPPLGEEETRPCKRIHTDSSTSAGEVPTLSNEFGKLRDYIGKKFTELEKHIDKRFTKIEEMLEDIITPMEGYEETLADIPHRLASLLAEARRQKIIDTKYINEDGMLSEAESGSGVTSLQIGCSTIQPSNPILHTHECTTVDERASKAHPDGDTSDDSD